MSKQKAKQIEEFRQRTLQEKMEAVFHRGVTPQDAKLHGKALWFKGFYMITLAMRNEAQNGTRKAREEVKARHRQWLNSFTARFHEDCRRKDGRFFRALADVIEDESNTDWSKREKFILAQCSIAKSSGQPLPSAAQLLRGWRISCGILPTREDDRRLLWKIFFGDRAMSKNRRESDDAELQRRLGSPNKRAADVQIIQIRREAANMGFKLPKQSNRKCLPAGFIEGP
jgi:hypothetical protein